MNFHLTIRVTRPAHPCLPDLITLWVLTEEQLRHFVNWMRNLEVCKYFVVEATVLGIFFSRDIKGSKSFIYKYISHGATATSGPGPPHCRGPLVGQGLLTVEGLRPSDTPHSVGLLWTSDQLDIEDLYLTTYNNHNRKISSYRRDSNPQSQQGSGRKPTP